MIYFVLHIRPRHWPQHQTLQRKEIRCVMCCIAVKQLQLRHCPAILSISIVDRTLQPLPGCLDAQQDTSTKTADMTGGHHAVICTEDQLKVHQRLFPAGHFCCLLREICSNVCLIVWMYVYIIHI